MNFNHHKKLKKYNMKLQSSNNKGILEIIKTRITYTYIPKYQDSWYFLYSNDNDVALVIGTCVLHYSNSNFLNPMINCMPFNKRRQTQECLINSLVV